MTHESWKSSRKMTTHLWNRSLIWEWAHGSGSNSTIMFLSLFLESHTVQWQCRKVRVRKGKNAMNITMREGKSTMNILLFYSTTSFLNSPEHWHAWYTSVIGTTGSMGQRMWTKLIALWTPSRKQLRCYLGTLLKRSRATQLLLVPFPTPLSEYLSLQWKKKSHEKESGHWGCKKYRNLSISGSQFRKRKREISGIWCGMVGWKKTYQHNNCLPRGV